MRRRVKNHNGLTAAPTSAERNCIQLLTRVLKQTSPQIFKIIAKKNTAYTVARTDVVLGELTRVRGYRSIDVYLAEKVFVADFAEALSIFLHEHAHIFGHDGDRGFTDALTELIETIVRYRAAMDGYETEWQAARVKVQAERRERERMPEHTPLDERLASLNEKEMRDLLYRIPEVVLKRLM